MRWFLVKMLARSEAMYDPTASIDHIEARFPEIAEILHDEIYEGLLHLQMACFADMAQKVIDKGDEKQWHRVTETFIQIWVDCTPDVLNALNVSFLEHLHFKDVKKAQSWAYKAMPAMMREAWDDMDQYNRKIHGGE